MAILLNWYAKGNRTSAGIIYSRRVGWQRFFAHLAEDGRVGYFDVGPYLEDEALFEALQNQSEFAKVTNGGYFIEWDCGADLSADTIEARWRTVGFTNLKTMQS